MAVTDLKERKAAILRSAAEQVDEWLEAHPPPPMPDYVSTVDGHVLRLDPSGTQYIVVSGLGDPREARMTAQRLNEAAAQERAMRALGLIEEPEPEDG